MEKQVIAITGARGFIGSEVARGIATWARVIKISRSVDPTCAEVTTADFRSCTQLGAILQGVDTVVHLGGPAHTTKHQYKIDYYDREVTENSLNLFDAAIASGVKHFIFASSIKVYGEETLRNEILNEESVSKPISRYGIAKRNAEIQLRNRALGSDVKLSIIRFPPVYGRHSKGSIRWLIMLSRYGIPMPISNISSVRSLLYISNAAKLVSKLASGELADGLYCPTDGSLMTVGEFYKECWYQLSPWRGLLKIIPSLPDFIYLALKNRGIMRPLFSSFAIQSNYQEKYRDIGFVSSRQALSEIRQEKCP
jgi:nucleoside-diphosphate-sugar epimerase